MIDSQPLESLRAAAQHELEASNFQEALLLLEQCFEQVPEDPRSYELLGLATYATGHYGCSVNSLERASSQVPLRSVAQVCLAHGYAKIGRTQLSHDLLIELGKNLTLSNSLLLQIATGLDQINQSEEAIQLCRVIARRDSNCAQAFYDQGFYLGRLGKSVDRIVPLVRRAIALAPDVICYRVGLAGLFCINRRYEEAYELISELSNQQIESIECLSCMEKMTRIYERRQDFRRTVIARQRMLQLEKLSV